MTGHSIPGPIEGYCCQLSQMCPVQGAGATDISGCSELNYAKPFRLIARAWAPRRLHLFLHPPTFPAPGAWTTVGARIKGDPNSIASSAPSEECPIVPP
jgi:hypothetical protein